MKNADGRTTKSDSNLKPVLETQVHIQQGVVKDTETSYIYCPKIKNKD